MKLIETIRARLVPEVREWWRFWSIRLNAAGIAILAWVQFDPVGVLYVFNLMPPALRRLLPPEALSTIGLMLFVLAMIARLVRQPRLEKNRG